MPEEQTILFEKSALAKVGKSLYDASLPKALEEAQEYAGKDGHVASMPKLASARTIADGEDFVWKNWFTCASEEDKGKTKQGKGIYVVAHGKGILIDPKRIRKAYADGLVNGAAKYTQKEFNDLLEGNLPDGTEIPVFSYSEFIKQKELPLAYAVILDFDKIAKLKSGVQEIDSLRDNNLVIARLGKEESTNKYLDKAKQVYGSQMGNWHGCANIDLDIPQGRLVFLGDDCDDGLLGYDDLDNYGRFVGVSEGVAQKIAEKKIIQRPSLEQILKLSKSFVSEHSQKDFEEELRKMYN